MPRGLRLLFPEPRRTARLRVVLDASVLLGGQRSWLVAGAFLHYYDAYWSSWIIGEFVRKRTEWIAERAVRDGCDERELRRRLRSARSRVNAAVDELSRVLHTVDYSRAAAADLAWLMDADDWPVMQTALVARARALVTDNRTDFPLGERRNGVLLLGPATFIGELTRTFPDAAEAIRSLLGRTSAAIRTGAPLPPSAPD